MYFSVAPQTITLPNGSTLNFCVDPVDSSIVTLTVAGEDGSVVCTFKRNGELIGTPEHVDAAGDPPAQPDPSVKSYPSVDDDAVRADDWKKSDDLMKPTGKPVDTKPAP